MTNIGIDLDGLLREEFDLGGSDLERLVAGRLADARELISRERQAGALAFLDLPDGGDLVETIRGFAEGVGQAFENVVVLAAGGSAPGVRALLGALLHPSWNELGDEYRDYYPRIFVLDTIDPDIVGPFLRHITPARTLFNVVSRSGGTPATTALYLVVRAALEAQLGEGYRRHFVFTTEESGGAFRALAETDAMAALPYPAGVPGSLSVFSAAGLLPAALVGIEIEALLAGARTMRERCLSAELTSNPAALLAAALHLADGRLGTRTHVLASTSERLGELGPWFRQLWSATLARGRSGEAVPLAPMPATAIGAREQFAQLDVFHDDPPDKLFLFVRVHESMEDLEIPSSGERAAGMGSLAGQRLGELQRRGDAAVQDILHDRGRPVLAIDLKSLGAEDVGQLFTLLQLTATYAAALYGVAPDADTGADAARRRIRERLSEGDRPR